ncbi:threonine dehydratase, catabolic [Klebsiella pneumoniae]|uniref:Threonine dehydratase, catabolic n=1 Tax=Klebsiella pneumoniae TaxID=573 RepID=A0A2X1SJV0_KLEPN|nr:threonine dehydratase, catabolic [Klebsiella pneumoniae]
MKSPRQLVDDIVLVSEDDIRQSMVALIQRNKVITEGAGALACAALLSGKLDSYIQNRKNGQSDFRGQYRSLPGIANYRFC